MNVAATRFKEAETLDDFGGVPPAWAGRPTPFTQTEAIRPKRTLRPSSLVFFVDNSPGLAAVAGSVLDHAGFPTSAFDDNMVAWHAFAFAPTQPLLLVVYDSIANLSGRELIRLCRAITPDLKVILVKDDSSDPARLSRGIADGILAKPFAGAQLVQAVRWLCGQLLPDSATPRLA